MATLIIRKYQNRNTTSQHYGKWYGRLVPQKMLSTDELCNHIAKTTGESSVKRGMDGAQWWATVHLSFGLAYGCCCRAVIL